MINPRKISKYIVAAAPILAVVLVISEVVISNRLAILGNRLTEVDKEIRVIEEENERLATRVASASSLTTITSRSEKLGFEAIGQYVSFGDEQFSIALGND